MTEAQAAEIPTTPLSPELAVPRLGLGTWDLRGKACERAVATALELGYRHIDTAEMYENEAAVGRAIAGSERSRLFITSKVWYENLRLPALRAACSASLERLGTDDLDLYLIHWPNGAVPLEETVSALKGLRDEGLIRAWGVSNFTAAHLEEVLELGRPAMNQVEVHPYLGQSGLQDFCDGHGIPVTAYTPLAKGEVMGDEVLARIASRHGKSPAQVALRWSLQHGRVVIPKSGSEAHQRQNLRCFDFELTDGEMRAIDGLDRGRRFVDPSWSEFDRGR